MRINSNYNTAKVYHVLCMTCTQHGKVVADENGDTYGESVEGAILTLKHLDQQCGSHKIHHMRAAKNVLRAAYLDF